MLPALGDLPAPSSIFAQIGGAAISIPAEALRRRATVSQPFMQLTLRFAQSNASQADQSVACNALHNVAARLSRWLLMTEDRVGNDMVPLTQEYLAVMVGVQRTTVSAAAAELKAAKLIRYVRGRIEIIDRPGLEKRACECYEVVHDAFARLGGRAGGGGLAFHPTRRIKTREWRDVGVKLLIGLSVMAACSAGPALADAAAWQAPLRPVLGVPLAQSRPQRPRPQPEEHRRAQGGVGGGLQLFRSHAALGHRLGRGHARTPSSPIPASWCPGAGCPAQACLIPRTDPT